MAKFKQAKLRAGGVAAAVGVALLVAACGGSSSSSSAANTSAVKPPTPSGSATNASAAKAPTSSSAAATGLAISTAKGSNGTYLTGASGRAVYLWVADSGGKSNCSGACAGAWPPLIAKSTPIASGGVKAADLGTITRADGSKQVTYNGHPLYYFAGDPGAGTTRGQGNKGFGADWWLVAPSGAAIMKSDSDAGVAATSSSSSSVAGY